jgi:hypothetical protein
MLAIVTPVHFRMLASVLISPESRVTNKVESRYSDRNYDDHRSPGQKG